MHFPYFMRRVNRVFTNRVLGTIAWVVPPLAMVHHVGRKSGREYRTPVVAFPHRTGYVVPLTYGRDVQWLHNMCKAGRCKIEQMGKVHPMGRPRVVDGDAAYEYLPPGVRTALRAANLPGFVLLDRKPSDAGKP